MVVSIVMLVSMDNDGEYMVNLWIIMVNNWNNTGIIDGFYIISWPMGIC